MSSNMTSYRMFKKIRDEAETAIAVNLDEAHGIENYDFKMKSGSEVKGMKHAMGWCDYRKREIVLNTEFLEVVKLDAIADTIMHEIAHAIAYHVYGDSGHGKYWKMVCRQLGCIDKAKAVLAEDQFDEDYVAAKKQELAEKKKQAKWMIVMVVEDGDGYVTDLKVMGRCHRRLKNMARRYYPSVKGSQGKLYLLESKFENEPLSRKVRRLVR